jgi:hypothetical protein
MITVEDKRNIEKIGNFGELEAEFTMKGNAKSFRALIKNIYSDKVKAAIQEVSTNGWESHVVAGNPDVPIHVTLPTTFNPIFGVRDFGTGLSHKFMMEEYSIAFHSTKDKTNDLAGSFGVGRLVLLSLSDSFVATCFEGTTKRTYSILYNASGVPSIIFLGEEKSNELRGFHVECPVDPTLATEFQSKAREIYKYYKVKPIIKNIDNFIINEVSYVIEAEDKSFGLAGSTYTPQAIMSVYNYPIDIASVTGLDDLSRKILMSGAVIHFELGELNVSIGRESLHYDKHTVENIKKKLHGIIPQIAPVVEKQFLGKNIFEKLELAHSLLMYNGKFGSISDLTRGFLNAHKIPSYLDVSMFETRYWMYDGYKGKAKKAECVQLHPRDNSVYYLMDKKSNFTPRAKKFFEDINNRDKRLVFFWPKNDQSINDFKLKYDFDVRSLPKMSILPYDKVVRGPTGARVIKTLVLVGNSYRIKDCWEEEILDPTDNIIYVKRHGYNVNCPVYHHRNKENVRYIWEKISQLEKITGQKFKVFALSKLQLKLVEPHWKFFEDLYKEEVEKYKKKQEENIGVYLYKETHYASFPESLLSSLQVGPNTLCAKILKEYEEISEISKQIDANIIQTNRAGVKVSDKYKFSVKDIKKHYPLLQFLHEKCYYNITPEVKRELEEYVEAKKI